MRKEEDGFEEELEGVEAEGVAETGVPWEFWGDVWARVC